MVTLVAHATHATFKSRTSTTQLVRFLSSYIGYIEYLTLSIRFAIISVPLWQECRGSRRKISQRTCKGQAVQSGPP